MNYQYIAKQLFALKYYEFNYLNKVIYHKVGNFQRDKFLETLEKCENIFLK